jgi:hypothetical protein
MRLLNDSMISGDVDLSASWTSDAFWLGHMKDFSIQLVFSGFPAGVFRLQCSNDRENNVESASGVQNWSVVQGSTQTISAAGDHTWAISNAGYRWVRVQWVSAMGSTGTLSSARVNGKGV